MQPNKRNEKQILPQYKMDVSKDQRFGFPVTRLVLAKAGLRTSSAIKGVLLPREEEVLPVKDFLISSLLLFGLVSFSYGIYT